MGINPFSRRFKLTGWLLLVYIFIGFLTRCILLFSTHSTQISAPQVAGAFSLGLIYDLTTGGCILIPFILLLWFENEWVYKKERKWIIATTLILIFLLAIYLKWIPKEFNSDLYKVILIYIWSRIGIFVLLGILGKSARQFWRKAVLYFILGLTLFLLLFNMFSEYFFWQEFSARYNFIAVDYLVYTNEVLGNIRESYPVGWIIGLCLGIALVICFILRRKVQESIDSTESFLQRSMYALILIAVPLILLFLLKSTTLNFSRNEYANELSGNGIYQFVYAFRHNELDYQKYYPTINKELAFSTVRKVLGVENTANYSQLPITREVVAEGPPHPYNIVLISVESLSASFMKAFGNTGNITPQLDSLAQKSWFFTRLYATGTRTVRGLEALSMGVPPTPGQSILKREGNKGLFTLGNVLRNKGYTTQYLYGGYSYFDNMKDFFSNNGYDVIDRTAIPQQDIHYQNIWGVADEDLFTLALKTFDHNESLGKPFFSQIMTVSNHRPYTFPANRIDISPKIHSREGAVKYTDYAIGEFIRQAKNHSWFDNTIFVIVADHCASSAGNVELPVTGYHIPMLIFAPSIIPARTENTLVSQIDIPPTLLGLLNLSYQSKFFGVDIRRADSTNRRAFISTYQGLGYLRNDTLAILSPVRQKRCYKPDMKTGEAVLLPENPGLLNEAISFYETAAIAYKAGLMKFKN